MLKNIHVSAIITTHNRSCLLERAIKSVLAQTYSMIELIVVDDASIDNTKDVCKKYDLQYIHIPMEESKGGNYARNIGIKAAAGDYIAFLDDDDYWLPEKIEKQVELILTKECEFVFCGRKIEYVNKDCIEYENELPPQEYSGDMSKKILYNICTVTSCIFCSRKALFEVGLFDENLKFWQEYDLSIRLAQRQPFYYVSEPLTVYRIETKDKNRLTNNYNGWKDATKLIKFKYKDMYATLKLYEIFQYYALFFGDSYIRLKQVGKKNYAFLSYMLYQFFVFPKRIIRLFNNNKSIS